MEEKRKPGGGRKRARPEFNKESNLREQMERAASRYNSGASLQAVADALGLNPIKVRKLLITAGVYASEPAEQVRRTFEEYRKTQGYTAAVLSTASALRLSKASVSSYLPYEKGVYFSRAAPPEKISAGAERQRRYRAVQALRERPCEETLWACVVAFRGYPFRTLTGLPFAYALKTGRNGRLTRELWIDRREGSKSLAWSSVLLAYRSIREIGAVVERPKALGDIRGVSYIYGIFYRFGLIDVPEKRKAAVRR